MTSSHNLSRRAFGSMAGACFTSFLWAARKKIPIGVQLYSVRKLCASDLPGTIAGVAKVGYQGVEFAGYYNRSAKELRKMLDDNGLKCCGTHIGIETLLGDNLAKTVEFNQIIGNRNLIVPGLAEKYRNSPSAWRETAKLFNDLAKKLKPQKMRIGYHNHTIEFQKLEGEIPWDIFCQNTSKDVITQLDIGHTVHAGSDPAAVLKRYRGRAKTVHVSDYSATKRGALIGDGDVKWQEVLAACEKVGGTEWYIIEEETSGLPGFEGIEQSLKRLHELGR
jgi:sugar phosphate isomerase/epimerase